jgi:hypothetical protein
VQALGDRGITQHCNRPYAKLFLELEAIGRASKKGGCTNMGKGRLEAFSDGVIPILITIMVLELKVPHEADLAALRPLVPVFLSYVLSFIYLGI